MQNSGTSQKPPRSFRNRIFLYILLLSSPPLLIWASFAFWGASQLVTGFLEKEIHVKAEEIASEIENTKTLNAIFDRFISNELKTRKRSEWRQTVRNMTIAEPDLYNVHVIAKDGTNIVRSDLISEKAYNYADRLYVRNALSGELTHQFLISRAYSRPAICTGNQVDREQVVVGLCRFVDSLVDDIKKTRIAKTGYVFLVDEEDRILAHPYLAFHSTEVGPADQEALRLSRTSGVAGRFTFNIDGEHYLGFSRTLSGQWKVIVVHNERELFTWAIEMMTWPVLGGVLTLILSLIMAYFAVERSTRPLQNLTQATQGLGPHNLGIKVPVETQDEMGQLAQSFNDMTDRLHQAFKALQEKESELQKSKEGLESLVLQQSQKLIYSTKMSSLGEMAGGIAHEVNNPLAIISLHTQKLKEKVESGVLDKEVIVETLDKVQKTCVRINQIIRGLRAFSRDGSQDPFVLENLSSIVWEASSLCSEAIRNRGIDLQIQCDAEIEVECQPVQIGQVLLNLLTNAKDAASSKVGANQQRWIRVEAEQTNDDHVEVRVTDSGPGISEQAKEKIMQPFFTTKQVGQGTGLGLSISKGIIQQHRGELFLNEKSEHTQFVIRLPSRQNRKN